MSDQAIESIAMAVVMVVLTLPAVIRAWRNR